MSWEDCVLICQDLCCKLFARGWAFSSEKLIHKKAVFCVFGFCTVIVLSPEMQSIMKKTSLFPVGFLVSHLLWIRFYWDNYCKCGTHEEWLNCILEHKCMIVNFMTTHTNLFDLKATSRRHITVCQRKDRKERNPFFNFFFSKYEVSLSPTELIKRPFMLSAIHGHSFYLLPWGS